jgi:hypothetical protein
MVVFFHLQQLLFLNFHRQNLEYDIDQDLEHFELYNPEQQILLMFD